MLSCHPFITTLNQVWTWRSAVSWGTPYLSRIFPTRTSLRPPMVSRSDSVSLPHLCLTGALNCLQLPSIWCQFIKCLASQQIQTAPPRPDRHLLPAADGQQSPAMVSSHVRHKPMASLWPQCITQRLQISLDPQRKCVPRRTLFSRAISGPKGP